MSKFLRYLFFAVLSTCLFQSASGATSQTLSQHGITWTFSKSETYGQYANGDFWVVGPVTITKIDPSSDGTKHGSMVNLSSGRTHAFDSRIPNNNFDSSKNIATRLPYTISPTSSLISSISNEALASAKDSQIKTFAVLTVVDSPPPEGSFRPSYIGSNKTHRWKESDLDYNALAGVSVSGMDAPSISSISDSFAVIANDQSRSWTYRNLQATDGSPVYGRDIANKTNNALLMLNSNKSNAQKRDLLVGMVQYGIDIYGIIEDGGNWYADGGINCGRLAPFMVAAATLNDEGMLEMLNADHLIFQEMQQTFFVKQADIDQSRYTKDGRPRTPYSSDDIGKPEWGIRHTENRSLDGDNWDAYYRDIGGGILPAIVAAARLMGLEETINDPAMFAYAQRHVYYREGRYKKSQYYNGYDDGDGYGDGNTYKDAPFASNETLYFQKKFFLTYENAEPLSRSEDDSPPTITDVAIEESIESATLNLASNKETSVKLTYWPSGGSSTTELTLDDYLTLHSFELTSLLPATNYALTIEATDQSGNSVTWTGELTTLPEPVQVASAEPPAGEFGTEVSVTLTSDDPANRIFYTTDGSTPTQDSEEYSGSVLITDSSVLKSIVVDESGQISDVREESYYIGEQTSDGNWVNIEIYEYDSENVALSFDARALDAPIDGVIGVSSGPASAYSDVAAGIRFNSWGYIDARKDYQYSSDSLYQYEANHIYNFQLEIDLNGHTYSVWVSNKTTGSEPVQIAEDFKFRTEQSQLSEFNYLVMKVSTETGNTISSLNYPIPENALPAAPFGLATRTLD